MTTDLTPAGSAAVRLAADVVRLKRERDRARGIAVALEQRLAAVEALADREHAGGCYYRHQQGEIDECNSCSAARVTEPLWADTEVQP